MPTHFDRAPGQPVTIRTYVHLLSDHAKAAHAAGWSLLALDEGLVDEAWLRKKPKWTAYAGLPVSFATAWQKRVGRPPASRPGRRTMTRTAEGDG